MDISLLIKYGKTSLQFALIMLVLLACNPDLDYRVTGYTQKIMVEGSIEAGKYPNVYLTLNVPLWKTLDSATVLDHVIRYAKVSITDGEKTEILTSKWDKTHFPPYVYQGTELSGEAGKNYQLKVEYSGYTLTANTHLPAPTPIDSLQFKPSGKSDSLVAIVVWVNLAATNQTGIRLFSKKPRDNRFIETPVVYNNQLNLNGKQELTLSPKPLRSDSSYADGPYFRLGETVDILISTIDPAATRFFDGLSSFSTLTDNIGTTEIKPLPSNISEPGFGIWYGSGSKYYRIKVGRE